MPASRRAAAAEGEKKENELAGDERWRATAVRNLKKEVRWGKEDEGR